jgi:hypothetical protein
LAVVRIISLSNLSVGLFVLALCKGEFQVIAPHQQWVVDRSLLIPLTRATHGDAHKLKCPKATMNLNCVHACMCACVHTCTRACVHAIELLRRSRQKPSVDKLSYHSHCNVHIGCRAKAWVAKK